MPSEAHSGLPMHVSAQSKVEFGDGGERSAGGGRLSPPAVVRGPQSAQSVPKGQCENSDPGPPSLQTPSEAYTHVSWQPASKGGEGGARGGCPVELAEVSELAALATAQIVKPNATSEPSVDQVMMVPAATCTFIGPSVREPPW